MSRFRRNGTCSRGPIPAVRKVLRICATRELFSGAAVAGVSPRRGDPYCRFGRKRDGSRRTKSARGPHWVAERAVRRTGWSAKRTVRGAALAACAACAALYPLRALAETIESALVKAYQNNPQL